MAYEPIDTAGIDRWIGQPIGGEQLKGVVTITDMRRWAQAMHNPNPLHYDELYARARGYDDIVPAQSFALACAIRQGMAPATQGAIPGARILNGGDEWWFGKRIGIGDLVTSVRLAFDYRIEIRAETGPTVLQRGDTTYINQHGEVLLRQRSTAIRFLADNLSPQAASSRASFDPPVWSSEQIEAIEQEQLAYARDLRTATPPTMDTIAPGHRLPRRIIGPHSIPSFTTEQRGFLYTAWGNLYDDGLPRAGRAFRAEDAAVDPAFGDGVYHGGSKGHTDSNAARLRGMPRAYGTGAAKCAYVIDYLTNWAGDRGVVVHCDVPNTRPVLVGDVTIIAATVADVRPAPALGYGLVVLNIEITDQNAMVLSNSTATVRLPIAL
jgi:acyl dehydratase